MLLIWLVIDAWAPRPTLISVITAPTPMIMPSMVSTERILLAARLLSATRKLSPRFIARLQRGDGGRGTGVGDLLLTPVPCPLSPARLPAPLGGACRP